ncbi:hypothetical protein E2562_002082 [Oryza meyeriana var. granulata]|uniref:Secreted protein n=1 Tax=Oryza meyeriana var. granulata TaxID=110450 RepID=A0A6G1EEJ4_9ORYZ|nr:hypothetical protein E2562_002082 [Oryza meyeriana var. granulata]
MDILIEFVVCLVLVDSIKFDAICKKHWWRLPDGAATRPRLPHGFVARGDGDRTGHVRGNGGPKIGNGNGFLAAAADKKAATTTKKASTPQGFVPRARRRPERTRSY